MAAKKKGPGKGRGPATRPPSPAKRTTIPKAKPPAAAPGVTATSGPPAHPASSKPPPATQAPAAAKSPATSSPPPVTQAPAAAKSAATSSAPPATATPAEAASPGSGKGPSSPSGKVASGSGKAPPGRSGKAPPGRSGKAAVPLAKGAGKNGPPAAKASSGSAKAAPAAKARPRGGPTREERIAAAEAARRRQSIRNKALLAAGVAAVVLVVAFVLVSDRKERTEEASQFQTDSCRFDRQTDDDGGQGRNHVANPTYDVEPPAGGDHTAAAAGAGIYTSDRVPADGQIVHALEHGFIVIWHRPDLDEQRLTAVRELAQTHPGEVLMVPRPSLETPVAATAWHARLLCGDIEVDTLERFITTFVDEGPEKGFVQKGQG